MTSSAPTYYFDHVCLSPQKQIPGHSQESWELSYIVTGKGVCNVGEASLLFSSGSLLLIPPGIRHCWHFDSTETDITGNIENITVLFERPFFDNIAAAFPELSEKAGTVTGCTGAVSFCNEDALKISATLRRMCCENGPERSVSMLSLLLQVASALQCGTRHRILCRKSVQEDAAIRLDKVRTYVSCNYGRTISIEEIARYTGMNRAAFCRFFRKHSGKTFVRYLNEYRVSLARQMLEKKRLSVSDICYACGFNDISYFCRTFKRIAGCTPSSI